MEPSPSSSPSKGPTRLICPLTSGSIEAMRADMLAAAAAGAEMIECRLDFLDRPPDERQLRDLLSDAPRPVIVTCRPIRQGGRYEGDEQHRLALLREAATFESVAAVDVEVDTDPALRPADKVMLSHHDFRQCPADLNDLAETLDKSSAPINKIAFAAAGPEDALRALDVLRACRKPTLALAMGEAGVLSRILAGKFAAYGTFAALEPGRGSAPGQVTLAEMRELYRWDAIGPATAVYGVIGCPVAHSMSPAIHNAAFAAKGIDAVYLPLRIEPGAENFNRFMDAVPARPWLGLRGLSVTIPHKRNALDYVGSANCDELAGQIGAVNTITISPDGCLRGDNSDYAAAIDSLCSAMGIGREALRGRRAAVLGAGGVARAIVAALRHYHAETTIYNRTFTRAEKLAAEFDCSARPLNEAGENSSEIVINCTSIGMHPNVDETPLRGIPPTVRVVFDTIYNPIRTRLLREATDAGCLTISGVDMFVNQAVAQFEIWTGKKAPREVMHKVVTNKLTGGE